MIKRVLGSALICALIGAAASASPSAAAQPQSVGNFSYGQLQASNVGATGCGTNSAGEPSIYISRANNLFLGSEQGLLGGSQLWRGLNAVGGAGASGCALEYRGQPNTLIGGLGLSGGDIDITTASAPNAGGNYNLYISSLNLASVNVARSSNNGATFSMTPLQLGLPLDDRPWIAAFGAATSLLTYHDIATNDIDVLRSNNGGGSYSQISQVIPATDYKASSNELGNVAIDHDNIPSSGNFYAYQPFVAPSTSSGSSNNEAFLGVSADGGHSWTDLPVPCSVSNTDLDHNFPNVSIDPAGNIWYAWSDDHNVTVAESTDHGKTWTCAPSVSTNTAQAIFPWLAATSGGVDLVYYGSPTTSKQTWYVYFAQNVGGVWGTPQQLMPVHQGSVCESGISCTTGRQLFDDFGVDTDSSGWAHIAFTQDSPTLGGSGSSTGYAVQTGGTPVGASNN